MQHEQKIEIIKSIYLLWAEEPIPHEIKTEVESEIGILIFQSVIGMSFVLLPEEKETHLNRLLNENKPMHELVGFLENEIEDFEQFVKDIGSTVMEQIEGVR